MTTPPDLRSPMVLMVEDEEETARAVRAHLEQAGYQVLHAKDGLSAQNLIDTMPPPDLILLAVRLPHLNGFDLLTYLKQQAGWEQVPIVMMAADESHQAVTRAIEQGVKDYVLKPFDPQQLTVRVGRLLKLLT